MAVLGEEGGRAGERVVVVAVVLVTAVAAVVASGTRGEGAQVHHEGRDGDVGVVVRPRAEHTEALEQLRKRGEIITSASERNEDPNNGRWGARFGAKDRGVSVEALFLFGLFPVASRESGEGSSALGEKDDSTAVCY